MLLQFLIAAAASSTDYLLFAYLLCPFAICHTGVDDFKEIPNPIFTYRIYDFQTFQNTVNKMYIKKST